MNEIDINYVFFIGGALLTIAVLASRLSSFFGTPILLLFLAIGMLSGEDGIFIKIIYNDYSQAFFISNLMLAIILLDGGLRTNVKMFRFVASESLVLATAGVVVTTLITGLGAYLFFDLSFTKSLLIGAIVGSTDAAAVFSLLGDGGVHLKERVSSALQIESATNDPMAILLTTVLLAFVTGDVNSFSSILLFLVTQFGLGIILGIVFGLFGRFVIASITLSPGLYTLLALGLGLVCFAITSSLNGSGFLAIFIYGMFIGNQNIRQISYILPVGEGLTWLSQITLFLILGLLVTPHQMLPYLLPGVAVAFVLAFIARPLAVLLCIKPFFRKYSNKEILFMSWVGLRGSVPIVLSIYPVMSGADDAQLFFNVAFIVVLFSLSLQGATLVPVAKLFKIYTPSCVSPINKSQVGIMLSDDFEMFSYNVKRPDLDGVKLRNIRFPKRTQIAGIFRDGHMLKASGDTKLLRDDIVSIIGTAHDEMLLNSIFSHAQSLKNPKLYKGDIILSGSMTMLDVQKLYQVELTSFEKSMSLDEFMSYHIGGFAQVGDVLGLINIELIVVEMSGDSVTRIGLNRF